MGDGLGLGCYKGWGQCMVFLHQSTSDVNVAYCTGLRYSTTYKKTSFFI